METQVGLIVHAAKKRDIETRNSHYEIRDNDSLTIRK